MRKIMECLGLALFLGLILARPGFGEEPILGSSNIGDCDITVGGWESSLQIYYKGILIWRTNRAQLVKKDWSEMLWASPNISPSIFKQYKDVFSWESNNKDLGFSSNWQVTCLPEKIKVEVSYAFERDIDALFGFWPRLFTGNPDLVKGCKIDVLTDTGRVYSPNFPAEYPEQQFFIEVKAVKLHTKIGNITIKVDKEKECPQPIKLAIKQNQEEKYDPLMAFHLISDRYPYSNKVEIEIAFDKEADKLFKKITDESPKKEIITGNLLPGDTSFETGVLDENWWVLNGYGPFSIDNSTAVDGKMSLKIGKDGIFGQLCFNPPGKDLENGETYILSAYLKSDEPTKGFMRIPTDKGFCRKVFDITSSWERHELVIPKFQPNADWLGRILIGQLREKKVTIWIDAVQLERGNKVTPYHPQDDMVFALTKDNPGSTYFKNEPKRLIFNFYNPKSRERQVQFVYNIKNYYGKIVKKGRLPLTFSPGGHDALIINFNPKENGFFLCDCKILEEGKVRVEKEETFCVLPYTEEEIKERDVFFGNTSTWAGSFHEGARLSRIGVGTLRVPIPWDVREKEKGKFNWSDFDNGVTCLNSHNIDILGVIVAPPPFACDKAWDLPKEKDFSEFIYKLMERYKGKIKYLELLNEPDHFGHAKKTGRDGKNRGEYVAGLSKAAYIMAKKASPECKILSYAAAGVGCNWWLKGGGKDFADGYFPIAIDYFDIFTGHYYCLGGDIGPARTHIVRDTGIKKILKTTVDYFKAHGYKKEMWASEQSWRLDINVPFDGGYAKEQARAVTKVLVQTRSFPEFKRFIWFKDMGVTWFKKYSHGIWREGYRPLPAVSAYATTAWLLKNVENGKQIDMQTEDIEGYIFPRGKENVAILWMNSTDNARVVLPSKLGEKLEIIDYMGNAVSIQQTGEKIQFELGRDPVFIKSKGISFSSMIKVLEEGISKSEAIKILKVTTPDISRICLLLANQRDKKISGEIKLEVVPYQKVVLAKKDFSLLPHETKKVKFNIIDPDFEKIKDAVFKITAIVPGEKPIISTVKSKLFSCPQISIKIDGNLKDWKEITPFNMSTPDNYDGGIPSSADDYSPQCFLSWDKEYLYFAATVIDDKISCHDTETGDFQHSDHYSLYLDTKKNASGKSTTFDEDDYAFSFTPTSPEGKPMITEGSKYFGGPGHPGLKLEKIKIASNIKSGGWELEVAIPWEMLKVIPQKEMILGVNFISGDTDETKRESISCWNKKGAYWSDPNACRNMCFLSR